MNRRNYAVAIHMPPNRAFSRACNAVFKIPVKRVEHGWPDELVELSVLPQTSLRVTCRIGFPNQRNMVYSFSGGRMLRGVPTIMEVDKLLRDLEATLDSSASPGRRLDSPITYAQTAMIWLFYTVVRRCFDFNLFQDEVKGVISRRQLTLWEFLTQVISKVWFLELLVEMRQKSEVYFDAIEESKIIPEAFYDADMEGLLTELHGTTAFGIPAYASLGEIVMLRSMNRAEVRDGFIDTDMLWIRDLHRSLRFGNYRLRYQFPYGSKISSFPVEVALSFKSPLFLDDKLSDWFGEDALQHPRSRFTSV